MKKNTKRMLSSILALSLTLVMAIGTVMAAPAVQAKKKEAAEVTVLPELTFDNYLDINAQQMDKYVSKKNVIPMLWQGLLEQKVVAAGVERSVKIYVPKDLKIGSMFVVMNVPEGQDTLTFMKKSGWMALADKNGFGLWVLEPEKGKKWGTPEEEMAYVSAAVGAEGGGTYVMPGPSYYVVGYGAIGTDLQKAVMASPLSVAAAAFFDASEVEAEYIETYQAKSFNRPGREYDVDYKDVPVPVLIASKKIKGQTKAMAKYWKTASKNIANFSYEKLNVAPVVLPVSYKYNNVVTTKTAWAFLNQYYRYGGGVCSNFISKKFDFKKNKVTTEHFTDSNGIDREYMAYVPKSAKKAKGNVPVVFAFHGASTSDKMMFENSLWYKKAEEEGFIVIVPSSSLILLPPTLSGGAAKMFRPLWQVENPELRQTDLVYIDELLDHVLANFKADANRLYCTGHSMGCMMTNYLGSSYVGERFAALGATSGPMMACDNTNTQKIPMWQTMAQYDMWSASLGEDGNGMVLDGVNYWLIQNGFATPENVAEVRMSGATNCYENGRYSTVEWADENGTVWYRYTTVAKKDHVNLPAENFMIWDDWFSKWEIVDGVRVCK